MQNEHKIYDVKSLLALDNKENYWLIDNMLPAVGKAMVYGEPGCFKSTLVFDLAVAVAYPKGLLLREFAILKHGPVLLVSTESSMYGNRDRLYKHMNSRSGYSREKELTGHGINELAPLSELPLYFCHKPFFIDQDSDFKEFKEALDMYRPRLVIYDPLDSFLSADENSARETKAFRRNADRLIEEHEFCLVIIHHATKGMAPTARGSSAWKGWVDAHIHVTKSTRKIGDNREVDVITAVAEKQREGQAKQLFQADVIHDEVRHMVTFDLHTKQQDDLSNRSLREYDVIRYLWDIPGATQKEISVAIKASDRTSKAILESLKEDGYVDNHADLQRGARHDGSRNVQGWRIINKHSMVDRARSMIWAEHHPQTDSGPDPGAMTEEDLNFDFVKDILCGKRGRSPEPAGAPERG